MNVVVGVTGPLGAAVARQLITAGQSVRGINRSGRGDVPPGVDLHGADMRDPAAATAACIDATVVYQCASAPYTDWSDPDRPQRHRWTDESEHLPAITEGTLLAARRAEARIVYGDNHYMYGPIDGPAVESLPWNATDTKGRARAAVAQRLLDADAAGDVEVAIGCASDFFGPGVLNSTVGDRLFVPAIAGERTAILGAPDLPHTYSYIDDVAAGLITLGREPAARGEVWNLPNEAPVTPRWFYEAAYAAAGTGAMIDLADPQAREEHGYEAHLMDRPFIVDDTKFRTAFAATTTPLADAIAATVSWFRSQAAQPAESTNSRPA